MRTVTLGTAGPGPGTAAAAAPPSRTPAAPTAGRGASPGRSRLRVNRSAVEPAPSPEAWSSPQAARVAAASPGSSSGRPTPAR
jgi:hypothetical protein